MPYIVAFFILVFALVPFAAAWAQVPVPPPVGSSPESYALYALAIMGGIVLTTGGQLVMALVNWRKNGIKLEKGHLQKIEESHKALHWTDPEGTLRPIMSGVVRQQAEESRDLMADLMGQLVENSNRQLVLTEELVEKHASLACVQESEDDLEASQ